MIHKTIDEMIMIPAIKAYQTRPLNQILDCPIAESNQNHQTYQIHLVNMIDLNNLPRMLF